MTRRKPTTLRLGTWNMHRGRRPAAALDALQALVRDHDNPHALALQETRDYLPELREVDGYRLFARRRPRGADQQAWLVRDDVKARRLVVRDLGGDGWTTTDGHHHVANKGIQVTIAGWLVGVNVHLPPSIDWPGGLPQGPPDRVQDYRENVLSLVAIARRRRRQGLLYVGDWNNRPGRDDGFVSTTWLAKQAAMTITPTRGAGGHLHGIDFPMVSRRCELRDVRQGERYGSDHPLVTFTVERRPLSGSPANR